MGGPQTLRVTGNWTGTPPLSYSYRWQRCKPGCQHITGATSTSYTLVGADVDARLRVLVTAKNTGGSAQAASREVGPVAPSVAQVRARLLQHLVPTGKDAKIAAVLKQGGYVYTLRTLRTLSGGRLAIGWFYVPKGSNLNRANHKPKPTLIATGHQIRRRLPGQAHERR